MINSRNSSKLDPNRSAQQPSCKVQKQWVSLSAFLPIQSIQVSFAKYATKLWMVLWSLYVAEISCVHHVLKKMLRSARAVPMHPLFDQSNATQWQASFKIWLSLASNPSKTLRTLEFVADGEEASVISFRTRNISVLTRKLPVHWVQLVPRRDTHVFWGRTWRCTCFNITSCQAIIRK